ncbi:MAG: serine hydrolase domain-containing protein [Acidobacteriota bacterium]
MPRNSRCTKGTGALALESNSAVLEDRCKSRRSRRSFAGLSWILCWLVFAGSPLASQSLPTAAPGEVGLSAERLERIDAILQGHVEREELAGAVALIARRGRVAHFTTHGRMAGGADNGTPMRRDALFGIASMTKPVTSTAVMMLYEEDRLALTDPVAKYIPELAGLQVAVVEAGQQGPDAAFTEVPAAREVTILDLLRHTSGFTYDFLDPGPVGKLYREALQPDALATLQDFVGKLAELPLTAQPGTAFHYGVSTDVLGYIVEVISEQTLDQFFAERIFRPLGMHDTAFYVPKDKADRLVTLYAVGEDGRVAPGVRPFFRRYDALPALLSGGGGLVSTVADYARFLQMLLGGGKLDGVRLLSRKTVELMTTDHLAGTTQPRVAPGYGFGLGFAVRVDLAEAAKPGSVGEYAWSGIFNTVFFVDPQEELFAILMTQTIPFGHLNWSERFKALVYHSIDD